MRIVTARIPVGKTAIVQTVELYEKNEAKQMLAGKDWEIGIDIYSARQANKRIGWLASFSDGSGIYVEAQ